MHTVVHAKFKFPSYKDSRGSLQLPGLHKQWILNILLKPETSCNFLISHLALESFILLAFPNDRTLLCAKNSCIWGIVWTSFTGTLLFSQQTWSGSAISRSWNLWKQVRPVSFRFRWAHHLFTLWWDLSAPISGRQGLISYSGDNTVKTWFIMC